MNEASEQHIEPPLTRAACQRGRAADLGRRILEETVAECRAQEATLWLISPDGQEMDGTLNRGSEHVLEQVSVPLNDSVVGMVASNGLSVSIGPDDYHNPAVDQATQVPTLAMIAAPVDVGGRRCGVLSAINPRGGGLFSSKDLEVLSWKAYLMGLVLGDAHDGQ